MSGFNYDAGTSLTAAQTESVRALAASDPTIYALLRMKERDLISWELTLWYMVMQLAAEKEALRKHVVEQAMLKVNPPMFLIKP
jgi:hypothetical protein